MVRERILRFLQNHFSPAPPDLEQGPQTDPALTEILNEGVDDDFHNGRAEAIEKLESLDVAGFWLQAVGDGSPLATADHDHLETKTPHRMAWEAGFDDSLDYQEVSRIAHQLFAHHIGIKVTPTHGSVSDRAALNNFLQPAIEYATDFYGSATATDDSADDWDEIQYPRPTSLEDALEDARSLVDTEPVTYFWLQVLCDVGDSNFVLQVGGPVGETPNTFVDHPIEYVVGIPHALSPDDEVALNLQALAQHLTYGARATDSSVAEFADAALEMALELEYLHDGPTSV
jgi:hypothetical protein